MHQYMYVLNGYYFQSDATLSIHKLHLPSNLIASFIGRYYLKLIHANSFCIG